MAEPLVFRFAPGIDGHPGLMYMADLRCVCALCGHPQMQRFYHATPFHELTLEGLDELAGVVHRKAGYECENCGDPVGPEAVEAAALSFGFADDAGLIRIFVDAPNEDGRRQYELVRKRRLDPQELIGWRADPERGQVVEALDDFDVEEVFGRVFSPKLLWVELFSDWLEDPEGGALARVSDACWIVVEESEEMASELVEEIEDEEFDEYFVDARLVVVPLRGSVPRGLATHEYVEHMPGRWQTWLPEGAREALEEGRAWAEAHVLADAVIDMMTETFEQAQLDFEIEDTPTDTFFYEITTPGGAVYGRGVSVGSVVLRAVHTGMTPGDAARLTAEEIVGMLLDVWDVPGPS